MSETTQSENKNNKEDWMNSKWRPMMGWMYMCVCMCDFVVFPILWSLVQASSHGNVATQWQPITLQGAGLFHMAMGAIKGVAAFGRTQEKLAGVNNGMNTGYSSSPPVDFNTSPSPKTMYTSKPSPAAQVDPPL